MSRWSAIPVLALVLGAGCAGLVGDSPSPDRRVTPVELTSGPPEGIDVPTEGGRVDIDRVVARHEAALANRSFYRRVEREGTVGVREVWVDRDADVVRVKQSTSRAAEGAVIAGGRRYDRRDDGTVRTTPDASGDVPFVLSLSGDFTLRQFLARYEYRTVGVARRGGDPVAVLRANETLVYLPDPDPNETVHVRSRVYVDRRGVVRFVDHRETFSSGGSRVFRMTVETGLDRVPIPSWLDDTAVYGGRERVSPPGVSENGAVRRDRPDRRATTEPAARPLTRDTPRPAA
ncbi:hypothetical protein [Haloarcula litorea]|uniref:hypothetical protein n=1 Tax=Haloarcula litorea TaxID=3032579 RepID=UPI0023E835E3|nr:hypothetical protein [Halomicroarcula sp. GDY20]